MVTVNRVNVYSVMDYETRVVVYYFIPEKKEADGIKTHLYRLEFRIVYGGRVVASYTKEIYYGNDCVGLGFSTPSREPFNVTLEIYVDGELGYTTELTIVPEPSREIAPPAGMQYRIRILNIDYVVSGVEKYGFYVKFYVTVYNDTGLRCDRVVLRLIVVESNLVSDVKVISLQPFGRVTETLTAYFGHYEEGSKTFRIEAVPDNGTGESRDIVVELVPKKDPATGLPRFEKEAVIIMDERSETLTVIDGNVTGAEPSEYVEPDMRLAYGRYYSVEPSQPRDAGVAFLLLLLAGVALWRERRL